MEFNRIAVTPSQIEYFNLPTRPTKASDPRSKNFDGESVEVDALDSNTLRAMVRQNIERHIDRRALEIVEAAEASEREILLRIANEHGSADIDNERQRRRAKREAEIQRRNAKREARNKRDKQRQILRDLGMTDAEIDAAL
jgi:hypothetical protein